MLVTLIGGPLDGGKQEVPDDQLSTGAVILIRTEAADDPYVPGSEDVIEYLYDGDGTANYVAGLI